MKKLCLLISLCLALTMLCGCDPQGGTASNGGGETKPTATGNYNYVAPELYARFMTNSSGEAVTLSTGYEAVGENVLYAKQKITVGDKLTAPEGQPTRAGFDFVGWAEDAAGTKLWDFDTKVDGGITLYAAWQRAENEQKDDYTEPTVAFVEKKDESQPIKINGVLNAFVEDGFVRLTRAGIKILSENASDVKQCLNYTVNSATTVKSAVYAQNKVTVTYDDGAGEKSVTINVSDVSSTLAVDNTTYENKAVKYENNVHIAPYSVIMAGSSSMENWSTSVEDMAPVTTANVGIGGTTVEQWSEKLAQRLIYPYNPRAVIFYVGINNIINSNKTGAETGNALRTLFDDVHAHLPEAEIYFIMINKVPGYTKYYYEINVANDIVTSYASHCNYVTLIDAGSKLIKKSGKTSSAYFLTDGLHMSLCGYVIWGKEVKDAFIAREKEIYGL